MGQGIELKCSKCKTKFEFLEGIGMFDSEQALMDYENEFNLLKKYKDGINKLELKRILKNKEYILESKNYGYKTYQCQMCKKIINKFYFRLIHLKNDANDFVSEYKCNKCECKLEIVKDIDKCPICGGEFNKKEIVMLNWD